MFRCSQQPWTLGPAPSLPPPPSAESLPSGDTQPERGPWKCWVPPDSPDPQAEKWVSEDLGPFIAPAQTAGGAHGRPAGPPHLPELPEPQLPSGPGGVLSGKMGVVESGSTGSHPELPRQTFAEPRRLTSLGLPPRTPRKTGPHRKAGVTGMSPWAASSAGSPPRPRPWEAHCKGKVTTAPSLADGESSEQGAEVARAAHAGLVPISPTPKDSTQRKCATGR